MSSNKRLGGIGPTLPPGWANDECDDSDSESEIGPHIPQASSSNSAAHSQYSTNSASFTTGNRPPTNRKPTAKDAIPQDASVIGPTLPTDLQQHNDDDSASDSSDDPEDPTGTSQRVIGPQILPSSSRSSSTTDVVHANADGENSDSESGEDYGPALPPDLLVEAEQKKTKTTVPETSGAPQHAAEVASASKEIDVEDEGPEIGPVLPSGPAAEDSYEDKLLHFKVKEHLKNAGKSKREEWMTELPEKLTSYGLGARTFSKSGTVDKADTNEWTDSPADKARKNALGGAAPLNDADSLKRKVIAQRDTELEKRAAELNKSRGDSLIDQHQKKLKMDTEAEDAGGRKEFDRDADLNIPKKLRGGVEALKQRAGALSSKFSHGAKGAKYL